MKPAGLLKFDQIQFGYPLTNQPVMKDFNVEITPGTVTAILGPNGAGKSTLLHLALGWLRPRVGSVQLDGRPLAGLPRRDLGRSIALVPESERTPFALSVLDYVMLSRAP